MAGFGFPFSFPIFLVEGATTYAPTPAWGTGGDYGRELPSSLSEPQAVSVHTYDGIQLYQFHPDKQTSLTWSRELRDTSRCTLVVPTDDDFSPTHDILPWVHWVSVWDVAGTVLHWTGPIQSAQRTHRQLSISAFDVSAFTTRTRVPITKSWDAADPSVVAGELWDSMISQQGLNVKAIRRIDPEGDPFDYKCLADQDMLETKMKDLVGLGLRWTVVSGTPILGPAPKQVVTSLGEQHFMESGIGLTVDGASTFNDVVLRGGDTLSRARVELAGLNLQTIVTVDDMFGVSNVDRAVYQYARNTGQLRYSLTLPQGSILHPDAPVSLDQLIPSSRFMVEAFDIRFLMELESVEVSSSRSGAQVAVTMDAVTEKSEDVPELLKFQRGLTG